MNQRIPLQLAPLRCANSGNDGKLLYYSLLAGKQEMAIIEIILSPLRRGLGVPD
jgi:hypothetical protein